MRVMKTKQNILDLWTNYDECPDFSKILHTLLEERDELILALEKIEDPRKMDHIERDQQTQVYCLQNVAHKVLEESRRREWKIQ